MTRTRQSIERELAQQRANLNHIEEKIATYTELEAPIHLLNQRDQIRDRIAQLEEWLRTGQLPDKAADVVPSSQAITDEEGVRLGARGGDHIDGDKITVGDISGSTGIAIGRGAQATVTQRTNGVDLATMFAVLHEQMGDLSAAKKAAVQGQLSALEGETAKGEQADPDIVGELVQSMAKAAPNLIEGLVSIFTSSLVGKAAGATARFVLKQVRKGK